MGLAIEGFLQHKRALGHRYLREAAHLRALDRLAAAHATAVVTEALAREYVSAGSAKSRAHRLTVVRQLAQFIALDSAHMFVPPTRFLGIRRARTPIQILSREQYARFLDACDVLPSSSRWPQRGLIHGAALRILLLTGLRRGEALRLTVEDVDLDTGIVRIQKSKFGKSRIVPLAPDLVQTVERLRRRDPCHRRRPPSGGWVLPRTQWAHAREREEPIWIISASARHRRYPSSWARWRTTMPRPSPLSRLPDYPASARSVRVTAVAAGIPSGWTRDNHRPSRKARSLSSGR